MAGIRSSIQTNRRLLFFIAGLLIVISAFVAKALYDQKKENRALRLKMITMSETRRASKPWTQLIRPAKLVADSTSLINSAVAPAPQTPATSSLTATLSLAEQDTATIAIKLDSQMRDVQSLDLDKLNENILLAEEIITREPDSYDAYKAKLISMLVKEGKFRETVNDSDVNDLLENMAQFSSENENNALKEAAINSTANVNNSNLESRLQTINDERASLEDRIESLAADSPDRNSLIATLEGLDQEAAQAQASLEEALTENDQTLNRVANMDLIEISFKRLIAQGDFNSAADNAQSIIDSYPNAPEGYYYLVRSMQLQGESDQARVMLENAQLTPELRDSLLQKMEQERNQNPQDYWKNLKF